MLSLCGTQPKSKEIILGKTLSQNQATLGLSHQKTPHKHTLPIKTYLCELTHREKNDFK